MGSRKKLTVAILMGNNFSEYVNGLIQGFYACAKEENVNLIFLMHASIPRDTNIVLSDMTGADYLVNFSSIYDYVPLVRPDILILAYGSLSIFSDTPQLDDLLAFYEGVPCLILEDFSTQYDHPHLSAENYESMCECIQHLITVHGYTKIAFLCGPVGNHDSDERFRGYCDTMRKNGLTVTDTMYIHGDYSDAVDEQMIYLLDSNPGLEAIAFANDNMAKTAYRVCQERGIVIGRDLAITGFDDIDYIKKINPPLTSILHSSFLLSYRGLKKAINICNGIRDDISTIPSIFRPRASCGCNPTYIQGVPEEPERTKVLEFISQNIDEMVEDFFLTSPFPEDKDSYKELLMNFFKGNTHYINEFNPERYTFDSQLSYLKPLCEHPRISPLITLNHLSQLFNRLINYAPQENIRTTLMRMMIFTQQYIYSQEIQTMQSKNHWDLHHNWFVNSFTQDLISSHLSTEECLLSIMKRLQIMNIKSCYFFLRKDPVEYEPHSRLQLPDNLCLAAYYDGDAMVSYRKEDWISVSKENGVSDIISREKQQLLTTYILLSGKTQYGFLLCEGEPQDIPFISACSVQLGAFLRLCYLNSTQRKIRQELEASVKLIKEQNSILNFISEYDELTNLLNRRGFMEKAFRTINANHGKTAYVLFADLDHLKEINDCFGHSAGDFALLTVADYLHHCLPENAIIGRISGDEFVAFILSDMEDFEQHTQQAIEEYSNKFNQECSMPFYIEMSVGIYKNNCNSTSSVTDLMHQSDKLLYKDKANRRSSVKK